MERRGSSTDVCAGCLGILIDLDKVGAFPKAILATRKYELSKEDGSKPSSGRKDDAGRKNVSSRLFHIWHSRDGGKFFLCKPSHRYLFYTDAIKQKLTNMKMDVATLHSFSVFIDNQ